MMGLYVIAVLASVLCCSGFSSSQHCTLQINKSGGLILYNLSYDLSTTYMDNSCEAQWTTDKVIALKSQNKCSFMQPVLNVTDTSLTTSEYFWQLTFQLDCPDTGVFRKCNFTGVNNTKADEKKERYGVNNTKADEKEERYGSVIFIIISTIFIFFILLVIYFVNKWRKKNSVQGSIL